jgi:hypothetical protein
MCQLRVREQEFAYLDIRLICSRYSLHPVLVFWVASSHLIIDMFDMQSSLESWSKLYYFLDQCIFCNICDLKGRHEHTAVYARIAKIGRARHVTKVFGVLSMCQQMMCEQWWHVGVWDQSLGIVFTVLFCYACSLLIIDQFVVQLFYYRAHSNCIVSELINNISFADLLFAGFKQIYSGTCNNCENK